MSLRVTLQIVPFGEDINARRIGEMTISRLQIRANPCDYRVVVASADGTVEWEGKVKAHRYEDGAWELVRRATEGMWLEKEGG